jgi:hypothetical protein
MKVLIINLQCNISLFQHTEEGLEQELLSVSFDFCELSAHALKCLSSALQAANTGDSPKLD